MNVIDYLPPEIKNFTVCIVKTGSQLFCSNCKDEDYIIYTNLDYLKRQDCEKDI